jgi:Ca-activated chloride channel family protein
MNSWWSGLLAEWGPAWGGFAWPWAWTLLPLPLLLPPRRSTRPALRVPWGERLQPLAPVDAGSHGGRWLLPALAWLLLCAALARPLELGPAQAPPQEARQLLLAVDLSGSMSEEDMRLGMSVVDRLTAAKAVISDFLERRAGDRVGLLVFGQRAYMLTPLTLDLATVRQQLRDSVAGLAGRETALGDAIGLGVKRLREQPEGQRVLILLTDGVNTAGVLDPLKAAELARDEGVRVHTIAFGGSGGVFSVFGMQLPVTQGEDVDEATLDRISQLTGGRFFRARDTDELAGIYAEIERLEPIRVEAEPVRPRIERYAWPLAAALGLALLAGALGMLGVARGGQG